MTPTPTSTLLPHHAALLDASGIAAHVVAARQYRSVGEPTELAALGFSASQQRLVPALLLPVWNVIGAIASYQLRPDAPRTLDGKVAKYETKAGSTMVLDVPPPIRAQLGDPARPLVITEGVRKADSAVSRGLCCIALLGVWNWRGTNGLGGKTALPDWESIALNGRDVYLVFDSDLNSNPHVQQALVRLKAFSGAATGSGADPAAPHGRGGRQGWAGRLSRGGAYHGGSVRACGRRARGRGRA
jgi:Domain of unknown function (DUF3854)